LHEFKQFSTQDFHIQLEPCGAQKDLEVLQQTRYVLWQPKKQREKEDKKKCSNFKPKPLLLAKNMHLKIFLPSNHSSLMFVILFLIGKTMFVIFVNVNIKAG
jgi:hypothetical protein